MPPADLSCNVTEQKIQTKVKSNHQNKIKFLILSMKSCVIISQIIKCTEKVEHMQAIPALQESPHIQAHLTKDASR